MDLPLPHVLPVLQNERLTLRAMADHDTAALLAMHGDPLVMAYTDEAPFPDQDTVGIMLKSVRNLLAMGASLEWAIALHDGDELIGTCGLHSFDQVLRQAKLGCLLKRSAWGKGHVTEAHGLLQRFAGDVLRLNRLLADVAPENERAQRLFKRLGYQQEPSGYLAIDLHPPRDGQLVGGSN